MQLMSELHQRLLQMLQYLPSDFQPYGARSRDDDWGPDCSCGCKYFLPLYQVRLIDLTMDSG